MLNQNYQKNIRRIKIISAFVIVLAIVYVLIYLITAPPATCSDGKQNQGEKGIDCGGPCGICKPNSVNASLVTKEVGLIDGGNGTYDAVAKIYNPNDSVGAKSFKYTFTVKDENGAVIAKKEGTNFILPVDTKYVTEMGLQMENNAVPKTVEIAIEDTQWASPGNVQKPQLGVYNKRFVKQSTGEGNVAQGVVRNESGYDLNKIMLVVVLRDAAGKIVAVSTTEKNMVRAGEQQEFRLNWPYSLESNVQNMEVDAQSNILDPDDISIIK